MTKPEVGPAISAAILQATASTHPGVFKGQGDWDLLRTTLREGAGLTVVEGEPLSGTSGLLRAVAGDPAVAHYFIVDGRRCVDLGDLAMAIIDAAVRAFSDSEAYVWWSSGQSGARGAGRAASALLRKLADQGMAADEFRFGGGSGLRNLDKALRFLALQTESEVTLVIDHFELLLRSLSARTTYDALGVLRAAFQEEKNLNLVLVEFPDGPSARALKDAGHPLFGAGPALRIGRPRPEQLTESLMALALGAQASRDVVRETARLTHGVASLAYRALQLAGQTDDPPAEAALRGWRRLQHYSAPQTAQQWDGLRAVHRLAPWIAGMIARGGRPHQLPANPKSVGDALAKMRSLGIVWQPEPRRWALADPLLSAWGYEHAPLWVKRATDTAVDLSATAAVSFRNVGDETVLLDEATWSYVHLNRTASALWGRLAAGTTVAQLADALVDLGAAPGQAEADAQAFVREMRERGYLTDSRRQP